MSKEISNKSLAILLVGAIIVSLMGTFISINRLNQISPGGINQITGFAGYSGNVTLEVSSLAEWSVNTNVDFGQIQPNTTGYWISTNSNNTWANGSGFANNCIGANSPCQGIEIENIGNKVLNLSFNTTSNSTLLIGGSNPSFKFNIRNGNRTGVGSQDGCTGIMPYNLTAGWFEISRNTDYVVCNSTATGVGGFNFSAYNDKITMEFNLTIPADAPEAGTQLATITFFNT